MKKLKLDVKLLRLKAYSKEIENMSQRTNSTSSTGSSLDSGPPLPNRFVPIDETDFDWNSIIMEDPVRSRSGFKSKVFVMEDGVKKTLSFQLADQNVFGINHEYGHKPGDKLKKLQINYPMTSFYTQDCPTEEEEETFKRIELISAITAKHMVKFYNEGKDMPKLTKDGPKYALMKQKSAINLVKPLYSKPQEDDSKSKPKSTYSKPFRMYIKLNSSGTGENFKLHSSFIGRKRNQTFHDFIIDPNQPFDPTNKIGLQISVKFESVFFSTRSEYIALLGEGIIVKSLRFTKPFEEVEPQEDKHDDDNDFKDVEFEDDEEKNDGNDFPGATFEE